MLREAQRFLDLDMVAQTIPDEGDRSLFLEAVQCYQIGSHRAAIILTWCATADCLKRRVFGLASEGDAQAQQSKGELAAVDGQACYEELLIACARKCELIDDYDEKVLRFARDTRSQCAHPTGVVPSAEAVRHILFVCTQSVLCRRGYRGALFIRDVVTVQFDDEHFLPDDRKIREHCRAIVEKVPGRLWPQFARIAADERPGPHAEVWLRNATAFIRVLLEAADDQTASHVAAALQGFEAHAPDFFAVLVGLDPRVARFWDTQKRAQARARLVAASAARITPDLVGSWANICAEDGFEDKDRDLLRQKFGALARHLPSHTSFLVQRRNDLLELLQESLLNNDTSDQAVIALGHLIGCSLFDDESEQAEVIVEAIIERFVRDVRYRQLLEKLGQWTATLLATYLKSGELYLAECSDENPDDVIILLDAAGELARRSPGSIPDGFDELLNKVLRKEVQPEWSGEGSEVGQAFRIRLNVLLQQDGDAFPSVDRELLARQVTQNSANDTEETRGEEMNDDPRVASSDTADGARGGSDQ